MKYRFFALLLTSWALPATAQTRDVHGSARTVTGQPVAGARVAVVESGEETITDTAGYFRLRTAQPGTITISARQIGFAPASIEVAPSDTVPINLTLLPRAAALAPIRVQAGAYTASNERGATLTALQIAQTPGATADVDRAIQTLPGVQTVDEGTGLFVRGGDVSETRVLLNDAAMLSPYNYGAPTGNFTVTVNPFLLDGIFFSSGGFGVRYGNILSGVADLRTVGQPRTSSVTGVAGLASASAATSLDLGDGFAVHATAARNDTRLLFKLNGSTHAYSPDPNGNDYSASTVWTYRHTGEVKTFAIDRHSALGIDPADPASAGGYANDTHSAMVTTGWKDLFGTVAPTVSLSYANANRNDAYGIFDLLDRESWWQAFTQTTWAIDDRHQLRVGGDADWRDARFVGTLTDSFIPAAQRAKFDSPSSGDRSGLFAEYDWRVVEDLRLIGGVRTDYSSFTKERTTDPRISAAYQLGVATITAAAGEYHQVSDPLYFASGIGTPGLRPMAARQYVTGIQVGEDKEMARVEVYDKEYQNLVELSNAKIVSDGNTGRARGADVFVQHQLHPTLAVRLSYSYVDSRRTDPDSHLMAPAPFDVTNSFVLIADQQLPWHLSVSGALRYATGKPVTPVLGATYDSTQHQWTPVNGAPYSERLPPFERVDLSLSRSTRVSLHRTLVWFVSVNNVLDRVNLYRYAYSADYSRRIPIQSLFNRSAYFGGSLTYLSF